MSYKSIEVYYDVSEIVGQDPLDFRNDAMHLIEAALDSAGLGEWAGAESGMGEVNFGFEVKDFDRAETLIRKTVAGTKYSCFREITRFEMDEEDF